MRKAIETAEDFDAAARAVLEIGATWTPDVLAALFSQAMQLAALEGREAVFADWEDVAFADVDLTRQEFREQIDFLTQKRGKPTTAWTDALRGDHDRAFVVAGVTDMAMLEEFQQAIIEGARTYDIKAFAAEFDRLVEQYGWSYNGGREWRIRTIFETNIRTSYMAGRLRQMRDPDVVKVRPFWQYRHGETRVPLNPRPEHVSWHDLVLDWNDPWWNVHFPPNDWTCSCGVRTLSRGDLRRMGKTGPDKAPTTTMIKHIDQATGAVVELPEGIGFGWDYMPGDLWEQGLVPSAIPGLIGADLKPVVSIDTAAPAQELIDAARPARPELVSASEDLRASADPTADACIAPFLEAFGAARGQAVLHQDQAGGRVPISERLFLDDSGALVIEDPAMRTMIPLLAEALLDPDEIWLTVSNGPYAEAVPTLDRRYVRTIKLDEDNVLAVVFELGRSWWNAVTAKISGGGAATVLDALRGGKRLWKRR